MSGTITQPIRKLRRSQDITVRCLPPQRARERTPGGVHSLEVVSFGDFVHVIGALPLRSRRRYPVQYRLLISEGGENAPFSSDRTGRIVGGAGDRDLLAPTLVGRLQRRVPFRSLDVIVGGDDTDDQGWLDLQTIARKQAARDRYMARYLAHGEFDRLSWKPDGALATIDLSQLPGHVEWLVVRLEVREIVHRQSGATRPILGNGRTGLIRLDRAAGTVTPRTLCDTLDESVDVDALDARAAFIASL